VGATLLSPRTATAAPDHRGIGSAQHHTVHLVQMLLPLRDNEDRPFPPAHYAAVRSVLTERFGGLTTYSRAPAEGIWEPGGDPAEKQRDVVVIYEVMTDDLDRRWWLTFRKSLEERFAQDELVIRTHPIERL
jgi:hypothetical protein